MAGMEKQFREGFAAKPAAGGPAPDAEGPADAAAPGEEQDPQDVVCPACGASAMKIVQAAQGGAPGGGAPPPVGM